MKFVKFAQRLMAMGGMVILAACGTGAPVAPESEVDETMPNVENTMPTEDPGMVEDDPAMEAAPETEDGTSSEAGS